MLRIKKLDIFVLKSFLLLFSGTFFICLFIFMMQFLWRYVDELVGKGLEINVLAQFFFYSGLTLIPLSLPLAILLAALMTFGNFGERYELLSMKAAGIPLLRIMRPVVLFCLFLGGMSFFFQNEIGPRAQKQLWTLLVSMKQKSPEVDIPEGVFYSDIDGYNIYVKHKDRETGMLKDVLIYNFSDGFENAHIIWAEEGKLELTADKQHLFLHLYNGEQFENLKSQSVISRNVPYRRESFKEKHTLIQFDSDFNMVDGSFLDQRSDIKNMREISQAIDSLEIHADSVGRAYFNDVINSTYKTPVLTKADSTKLEKLNVAYLNTDSIFNSMTSQEKSQTLSKTENRISSLASDWEMKSFMSKSTDGNIRSHRSDWHKKITLSLACIIFFFIGAPLGAIIRKGGLGMPVVISVLIFVVYYIIDSGATRIGKSGEMNVALGTWMSTLVLAPVGAFFTYKSNKDSVVFNIDTYAAFFRKVFGIRLSRHLFKKEVIIHTPEYRKDVEALEHISALCEDYMRMHRLKGLPNYIKLFMNNKPDDAIADISRQMEAVIEELSNSKDPILLNAMNNYPFLAVKAHKSPFGNRWLNLALGIVVPVGLLVYLHIWRFRLRLEKDLKNIIRTNGQVIQQIKDQHYYS
ncbi:LptF/LptG family permease [Bacteroides gallinaceum]|uniref:LptF/LptG family permease n=1 Tax=Bacteroides gallinaceum TaxID=1462571 RepID=UPI0025AAC17F|nr:LptF/LptG family permease [Bacteroides gallinaceum]MDN0066183.1 LptF/LptG family permease [Bacteroides gallinaceum]